jgi:hypothetical protein
MSDLHGSTTSQMLYAPITPHPGFQSYQQNTTEGTLFIPDIIITINHLVAVWADKESFFPIDKNAIALFKYTCYLLPS